ncbi:MAG TPA: hypothetical protein VJ842_17215 [Pyrinomonadaceae bacterium]|nr:hypothetical protein [Pyrinomonadaceae bacterium]
MKATRDLLIHNSGVINDVYLSKVEAKKRGERGERILINAGYFDHCISTLKRLSGIVKRDIEIAFPSKQ